MRLLHEQPDLNGVDPQLAAVLRLAMQQDPRSRPDAQSLLTIFADGAGRRGATMSYPRSIPAAATAAYGALPATQVTTPAPDRRPARLAVSALILLICLIAGSAAYLVARVA